VSDDHRRSNAVPRRRRRLRRRSRVRAERAQPRDAHRAEAERNESERSVADGENIAGALEEVRKANAALRDATAALQKAREDVHALKLWAQRVVYEMKRRNMTPPEMPAVLLDTEEA